MPTSPATEVRTVALMPWRERCRNRGVRREGIPVVAPLLDLKNVHSLRPCQDGQGIEDGARRLASCLPRNHDVAAGLPIATDVGDDERWPAALEHQPFGEVHERGLLPVGIGLAGYVEVDRARVIQHDRSKAQPLRGVCRSDARAWFCICMSSESDPPHMPVLSVTKRLVCR
jgi:hypothetical protein